jgi:hypothetical protein
MSSIIESGQKLEQKIDWLINSNHFVKLIISLLDPIFQGSHCLFHQTGKVDKRKGAKATDCFDMGEDCVVVGLLDDVIKSINFVF